VYGLSVCASMGASLDQAEKKCIEASATQ